MHGFRGSRSLAALVLALPLLVGAAAPQNAAGQEGDGDRLWRVDDLLMQESAGDFRVSPDGRWVVWVRSGRKGREGERISNLWLTRVEDGESWALTRGRESDRSPRWSPDGTAIAFASSREVDREEGEDGEGGGSRIWILRLRGGEPRPLTTDVRGLRSFEWKGPSADTLVFLAREMESRVEADREGTGFAVEDTLEAAPVRLWSVAVESGKIRRVTTNDDWMQEMAVSPDGRTAVVRAGVSLSFQFDALEPPRTWLVDLATGERTEILRDFRADHFYPREMQWAADGSGFYFAWEYSSHPVYRSASVTRMGFWDMEAGERRDVGLDWPRGLGQGFQAVEGGFVALLGDGVRDRPALYRREGSGWSRAMIRGEHAGNIWGWRASADASLLVYEHSAAGSPDQPYLARLEEARLREPERLVTLNPTLEKKPLPRAEVVRWTGARGDEVEGILYYPLGWEEGRPRPLVVNIHGGPAGRDGDRWDQGWSSPIVLWLQRGAFVLQPNYHGSCCYGLEWVESIGGGNYYSLEIPDIEAGVDRLIDRGLVHPDSVATQGWSNGAILSTALTVENPDRYRASLAGAGDVEWVSDWGNVDFGASFDNYYFGGPPWENPEKYMELSPYWELDEVRTPTLLFFGTEDRNVPPSQGWTQFRALQQMGNAPVRFVLFSGEPHGLRELDHQRRKVREEVRWLERHLWGLADTARIALKEGSRLAGLLARSGAARHDGLYGVRVRGVLAPETVEKDGLEVGRFEVTRAQWRAFDPEYPMEPGTENHPVTGVGFDEARDYVEWLSRETGRAYRLPTGEELRGLQAGAGAGVTLDDWAGYAPNPDDADRLRGLASSVPGAAPLVRQVGSAPADDGGSEPRVWDMGGNVAEWAVAEDGSGVALGRSADRPRDPAADERAGPAYRGLRVVRGGG